MTPDERELLCDLMRVCNHAPGFTLEFLAGNLSAEEEIAYAHRLVDVAEALMHHADGRKHMVIDEHITGIVNNPKAPGMPPK
jgi:hypothetical protein